MSLPGLYASDNYRAIVVAREAYEPTFDTIRCVLPVYVAGQQRSRPGLMLGLVLSSNDASCGECRPLPFQSDFSSALGVERKTHNHTPIWIENRRLRSCVLHQASGGALDPKVLRTLISHDTRE